MRQGFGAAMTARRLLSSRGICGPRGYINNRSASDAAQLHLGRMGAAAAAGGRPTPTYRGLASTAAEEEPRCAISGVPILFWVPLGGGYRREGPRSGSRKFQLQPRHTSLNHASPLWLGPLQGMKTWFFACFPRCAFTGRGNNFARVLALALLFLSPFV